MTIIHKVIGGFFELELPIKGSLYHDAALALTNGRVCFKVLLQRVKPSKVYLPYYICDSLILPLKEAQIPYELYEIDPLFEPILPTLADESELILYVNYFGLKTLTARKLSKTFGQQLVIDNTQAFFEESYGVSWAFNSARKFFGVPDGGFLYAPQYLEDKYVPNTQIVTDHLWQRLFGKQEEAYSNYQLSEAQQTSEVKGMSKIAQQILQIVNFPAVARARKRHYRQLDRMLRHLNQLPDTLLELVPDTVPFCYPLLLKEPLPKGAFYDHKIFIPTLWNEVLTRDTEGGYPFEKMVTQNLLPLPIDHRLDETDMGRLIDFVLSVVPHTGK
jgi:hypothetical protein